MTAYIAASSIQSSEQNETVSAFGAHYEHVTTPDGGDLWLTAWGLPYRKHLMPELWLQDGGCSKTGQRLGASTGHVYKLAVTVDDRTLQFVAKVSRMAQRVASHGLNHAAVERRTSFPSPFEELGQLTALRQSVAPHIYLFAKRPLGIFSPAKRIPTWMLDRVPHEFSMVTRRHAADAAHRGKKQTIFVELDRDYFTLFAWIEGFNLDELVAMGRISRTELLAIDLEVRERLAQAGFSVADHKPDHIIVRLDPTGAPRRRRGRFVAALADFELLERSNPRTNVSAEAHVISELGD